MPCRLPRRLPCGVIAAPVLAGLLLLAGCAEPHLVEVLPGTLRLTTPVSHPWTSGQALAAAPNRRLGAALDSEAAAAALCRRQGRDAVTLASADSAAAHERILRCRQRARDPLLLAPRPDFPPQPGLAF